MERDDWRKFDQDGPWQNRLEEAFRKIEVAREALHMMRWDLGQFLLPSGEPS